MTVFSVFHGISNASEILLYPLPDYYLSTMKSLILWKLSVGSKMQPRKLFGINQEFECDWLISNSQVLLYEDVFMILVF